MLEAKAGLSEERFVTYGFLCFFRNPIFSIPPFVFHIFPSPYLLFPSLVIPVERETASWTRDCCLEREREIRLFVARSTATSEIYERPRASLRCVLKHPIRSCECSYFDFVYSIEQTKGGGAKLESCAWDKRKQELNVNGVMTLTFR